jgi:putative effector of murein hydrolase
MIDTLNLLRSWQQPFIWLLITLIVYVLALQVFRLLGRRSVFHPLLLCMLMLGLRLFFAQQELSEYQQHVSLLQWLLGPATVALAVPLFQHMVTIKRRARDLLLPILLGGIAAPVSAVIFLSWGNVDKEIQITMLSKSSTTPLAMDPARWMGGYPELAAVIVFLTGIVGAVSCPWIFRLLAIKSREAQGIALGTVAHAIGTAQAFQMSEKSGAFATLALCVNGVLTAIILPLLFLWLT